MLQLPCHYPALRAWLDIGGKMITRVKSKDE